jgi:hypothetical protein
VDFQPHKSGDLHGQATKLQGGILWKKQKTINVVAVFIVKEDPGWDYVLQNMIVKINYQ